MHPRVFERQMTVLAHWWKPTPLIDLIARLEEGRPLDHREVVVTFDDGTDDTFNFAFPILARHRIPATVFLIADHVGKPTALSQNQIRTMLKQGITFGSHTIHHAYLPSLSTTQILEELAGSRRLLEDQLKMPIQTLSYPGGGFTPQIASSVREAGYRCACTTNRGTHRSPIDRWALRRISMHPTIRSVFGMGLCCSGYYGLNRRLRPPA